MAQTLEIKLKFKVMSSKDGPSEVNAALKPGDKYGSTISRT